MNNYFLNNNKYYAQQLFNKVINIWIDFSTRKEFIKPYNKELLISLVKEEFKEEWLPIEELIKYFSTEFIPYCINQASVNYIAFPDSGNSLSWYVWDIFKIFLNQNLIADVRSAPLGTYLEINLINQFRKFIWYEVNDYPKDISEVWWVYTYWWVMSVVTWLLVARSKKLWKSFKMWIDSNNYYILVPKWINHYSVSLAMWYLGFGTDKVIEVSLNKDFTINIDELETIIHKAKSNNLNILAIIAYAWDSRTMRIDNLEEISKISKKYNIWLHVDACHWWALLFSKKYKQKLKWIEKADSVTLDPHKVLSVTYPSSLVLFKNSKDLLLVSKNYDMTIEENSFDLWQITPFIWSKSFESLKLWFLIKHFGLSKLSEMVGYRIDLTKYFYNLLKDDDEFITMHSVNINSICFMYKPKGFLLNKENVYKLDKLNKKIEEYLYKKWELSIHSFKLPDCGNKVLPIWEVRQVLGIIIGNNNLTKKDLYNAYLNIKKAWSYLYNKYFKND